MIPKKWDFVFVVIEILKSHARWGDKQLHGLISQRGCAPRMCTSQEAKEAEKIRTIVVSLSDSDSEGQVSEKEENFHLSDVTSNNDWTSSDD